MSKPFIPVGQPLPRAELLKLAEFTQSDLDRAMGSAHPSLKPFLEAKPYVQSRQAANG